jgi:phytoene desaturase
MTTALVIGAGIGGITTAALLARQGYQVTVVEKNGGPGGRCDHLVRDGHHFDTGPTLFLMPEIFAQAFADLGERLEDHLDLLRIDPTYHLHFGDGSALTLTSNLNAMQAQLEAMEPGSFEGLMRYLDEGRRHYELVFTHIAGRNFTRAQDYFTPRNLLLILRLKALARHYANVSRYFVDERLRIGFAFQDLYVGLSPYKAPATYSLLQYGELAGGVWFPRGGMYRLVEALTKIAESNGVQFRYNAPAERIRVNGRQARGIRLDGGQDLEADVVVANADLPYAYRCLLPDDGVARRLQRKQHTSSTITFCWGVGKRYPQLGAHNLFIASDFRQNMEQIFEDRSLPDEPSFYLHAPARIDPSLAPEGQDTLTAVVPVGHMDDAPEKGRPPGRERQDWSAMRQRARGYLLQCLSEMGMPDLEEQIKFEACYTPRDWQNRYNLTKGSGFGLSHCLLQMGYMRPQHRHARYRNLYFVGASTHPGAGLPAVLLSARLVMERILGGER